MKDCSISIANALEMLQSCIKPFIHFSSLPHTSDCLGSSFFLNRTSFKCQSHTLTGDKLGHHDACRWPSTKRCWAICRHHDDYTNMFPLTHWGWDKMADISQTTFSNIFSSIKMCQFWLKFHWSLFLRVQLTNSSIVSDNGLAPSKRQAIIWSNAG